MAVADRTSNPGEPSTRERLLGIAEELFAERSYAGTSMSALAERLGTSKAALYKHFASKTDILDELLRPSAVRMQALADLARDGADRDELMDRLIDHFIAEPSISLLLAGDPSIIVEYLRRHDPGDIADAVFVGLAGSEDPLALLRAQSAMAAMREATLVALRRDGVLLPDMRAETMRIGRSVLAAKEKNGSQSVACA